MFGFRELHSTLWSFWRHSFIHQEAELNHHKAAVFSAAAHINIKMIQLRDSCKFYRGRGRYVQSGWILHLHLSESQTWTQHGPDWWEPLLLFFLTYICKRMRFLWLYCWFQDVTHFVFLFVCFLQIASELARTPGKSVTFSTAPNAEPSTPTRTNRSVLNILSLFLLFLCPFTYN